MVKVVVTGGAGFIGSHFIHLLMESRDTSVVNLDRLTYAGNLQNLRDVADKGRYRFVKGDICSRSVLEPLVKSGDIVYNFAAETHVDRSIRRPGRFVKTDILGTYNLLEAVRKYDKEMVQVSTDEVYGSASESFSEEDRLNPSSPYAASKAGADLIVHAYYVTYGVDVTVTRSSNNYGPNQYPEKMIPLFITNGVRNRQLPVYGDGLNVRDWLYVRDNCEAIKLVGTSGRRGEIYNVASGDEWANIEVAKEILKQLGKPETLIRFVKDRLGHDRKYSLRCAKIGNLGWKPKTLFKEGLTRTVRWYVENPWWWKPLVRN